MTMDTRYTHCVLCDGWRTRSILFVFLEFIQALCVCVRCKGKKYKNGYNHHHHKCVYMYIGSERDVRIRNRRSTK